jgi:hypothetical protein
MCIAQVWHTIFQMPQIAFIMGCLILIAAVIGSFWYKRHKARSENNLKRAMVDPIALRSLLTEAHDLICLRLRNRIPPDLRSIVSVEDSAQDTFCEVFRRVTAIQAKDTQAFKRWVLAIALSRLRNTIRRHRAQERGEEDSIRSGSPSGAN